jgi:hypothetical protein
MRARRLFPQSERNDCDQVDPVAPRAASIRFRRIALAVNCTAIAAVTLVTLATLATLAMRRPASELRRPASELRRPATASTT